MRKMTPRASSATNDVPSTAGEGRTGAGERRTRPATDEGTKNDDPASARTNFTTEGDDDPPRSPTGSYSSFLEFLGEASREICWGDLDHSSRSMGEPSPPVGERAAARAAGDGYSSFLRFIGGGDVVVEFEMESEVDFDVDMDTEDIGDINMGDMDMGDAELVGDARSIEIDDGMEDIGDIEIGGGKSNKHDVEQISNGHGDAGDFNIEASDAGNDVASKLTIVARERRKIEGIAEDLKIERDAKADARAKRKAGREARAAASLESAKSPQTVGRGDEDVKFSAVREVNFGGEDVAPRVEQAPATAGKENVERGPQQIDAEADARAKKAEARARRKAKREALTASGKSVEAPRLSFCGDESSRFLASDLGVDDVVKPESASTEEAKIKVEDVESDPPARIPFPPHNDNGEVARSSAFSRSQSSYQVKNNAREHIEKEDPLKEAIARGEDVTPWDERGNVDPFGTRSKKWTPRRHTIKPPGEVVAPEEEKAKADPFGKRSNKRSNSRRVTIGGPMDGLQGTKGKCAESAKPLRHLMSIGERASFHEGDDDDGEIPDCSMHSTMTDGGFLEGGSNHLRKTTSAPLSASTNSRASRKSRRSSVGHSHRNDKNDIRASFSFTEFRRDLSLLRRKQKGGDQESRKWLGEGSVGSCTASEDALDGEVEGDEPNPRQKPTQVDRRASMIRAPSSGKMESLKFIPNASLICTERSNDWARSFYHLDPRWQILTFFNDLAREGADKLESRGGIIPDEAGMQIPFIQRVFARAGVFSVWRPTSNDAIRKMMTGEGTGKGLDIKGKSAQRGKYSGFVPFLQIHRNQDKLKVGSLDSKSRVRVFYPNQWSRDEAASSLRQLLNEMVTKTNASIRVIKDTQEAEAKALSFVMQKSFKIGSTPNERPGLAEAKHILRESQRLLNTGPMQVDQQMFTRALEDKEHNVMLDPEIYEIDDYASDEEIFGLDLPEKLFWEGYVAHSDISWEEGSEHDTGRPSMPEFQVMNLDTLRKGHKKRSKSSSLESAEPEPWPVLYHGGCGRKGDTEPMEKPDPLCPLGLLIAYEEVGEGIGKVTPVVSDFDCFLLGTRGVRWNESLREQEHAMLKLCVDEIEGILSTPQVGAGWTKRWLEVKKKHYSLGGASSKEMPKFGYADPRSYTMMKGAVHRLRRNGAVRHGPECFNYGFPQELDDKYLVISDMLPGQVPWKYVNSEELIEILFRRIDDGFTFPLNPKWILCDPGWKQVYDKLMASNATNVQASMNIWYPEDIRRRIIEISTKFPQGFVQDGVETSHISSVSVDLAKMELERYAALRQGRKKLKSAMLKRASAPASANPIGGGISDASPTIFTAALQMLSKEADTPNQDSTNTAISTVPEPVEDLAHYTSGINGRITLSGGELERLTPGHSPATPERGSRRGIIGTSFSSFRKNLSWRITRKRGSLP